MFIIVISLNRPSNNPNPLINGWKINCWLVLLSVTFGWLPHLALQWSIMLIAIMLTGMIMIWFKFGYSSGLLKCKLGDVPDIVFIIIPFNRSHDLNLKPLTRISPGWFAKSLIDRCLLQSPARHFFQSVAPFSKHFPMTASQLNCVTNHLYVCRSSNVKRHWLLRSGKGILTESAADATRRRAHGGETVRLFCLQ